MTLRVYRTLVAVGGAVCKDFDVITIAQSVEQAELLAIRHARGVTRTKDVTLRDDQPDRTVEVVLDVSRAISIEEVES